DAAPYPLTFAVLVVVVSQLYTLDQVVHALQNVASLYVNNHLVVCDCQKPMCKNQSNHLWILIHHNNNEEMPSSCISFLPMISVQNHLNLKDSQFLCQLNP